MGCISIKTSCRKSEEIFSSCWALLEIPFHDIVFLLLSIFDDYSVSFQLNDIGGVPRGIGGGVLRESEFAYQLFVFLK